MLLSGAVAGLVGLPQLLGETHAFTETSAGIGFTGIAIALLGRNHPVGMAARRAAVGLPGAARRRSSTSNDIPQEIVTIMQGTTVLAVVVAYELAARLEPPGPAEAGRRDDRRDHGRARQPAADRQPGTAEASPA